MIHNIFICVETDKEDETKSFYGLDWTAEFVGWLEDKGVNQDGDDRDVIVIFHNLKEYDGMFLLQYCYVTHREASNGSPRGPRFCPSCQTD